jgi:uncharacterized protein (DUF885 family)
MKHNIRKIALLLILLFSLIISGCQDVVNSSSIVSSSSSYVSPSSTDNEEFKAYLDDMFIDLLTDSALDINYLLRYPEKYGLENEKVSVYTLSKESHNDYMAYAESVIKDLEAFNDATLSRQQQLDKAILIDSFKRDLLTKGFYYYDKPLGSYLGYQAQLPLILAEYRFDDSADIENYFTLIESTQESFESLIQYENEKVPLGLSMNDTLIDGVIEQCDNFINASEENYLIKVFEDKISGLGFLAGSQKAELNERNKDLINNSFVPAYSYLKTELLKLKGKGVNQGGLSNFTNGKVYYESLFRQTVGTDKSIVDINKEVDNKINDTISEMRKLMQFDRDLPNKVERYDYSKGMSTDEIISFLKGKIETDFPTLCTSNLKYEIKSINEALQENSSPAMYFLSPIDEDVTEVIYTNPIQMGEDADPNYIYGTLAHESIPGHLYQHVYFKSKNMHPMRYLISYTGYSEGWATYVENYVYKFTSDDSTVNRFRELNNNLYDLLMIKCDIGVNYYSWTANQLKQYLNDYYDIDLNTAEDIFNQMVEVPVNVSQYYYSYFSFIELKDYMRSKAGAVKYKVYDFHKIVLDTGPAPFSIIKQEIDRFISENY